MLPRPEVIQMQKSRSALLADPYPGEPYYQRLSQHLVGIDASASYVYGSAFCVGAGLLLRRLDTMVGATVARADYYWLTVLGPQHLELIHCQRIHPALAGLGTRQLTKREVRPPIAWPSRGSVIHYFFFGFGFDFRFAFRAAAAARLPAAVYG